MGRYRKPYPKRVYAAPFDVQCSRCGAMIPKGDTNYTWDRLQSGKWMHRTCSNGIGNVPDPVEEVPTATPTVADIVDSNDDHLLANGDAPKTALGQALWNEIEPYLPDPEALIDEEKVKAIVDAAIQNFLKHPIVFSIPGMPDVVAMPEVSHRLLKLVLFYVNQRSNGKTRDNVMLVGPSQSGKSKMAEQIADMLKLPFYTLCLSPDTPKSFVVGIKDAHGVYHPSDFRKWFEFGGVLLIDEIDNGGSQVMTPLNNSLANGIGSFPDGMVKRHPDAICIAAGNTYGRGGDAKFERRRLDAAIRERFTVVDWDYDKDMERKLVTAINPKQADMVLNWIWQVRSAARSRGVDVDATTTGAMKMACYALSPDHVSLETAALGTIWKGLAKAQRDSLGVPSHPDVSWRAE